MPRARGPYSTIRSELKERLIASWEERDDYKAAANVFNIKISTIVYPPLSTRTNARGKKRRKA